MGDLPMFDDLLDDTTRAIKNWTPEKKYQKEDGYRDDLLGYLREQLNRPSPFGSQKVTIQSESGRWLCDIVLNRTIGIELKKDLKEKAKIDRAIGQIHRYWDCYHDIIIVLVGDTDPNKYDDLREQVSDFVRRNSNPYSWDEKSVRVIDTSNKTNKKTRNSSQKCPHTDNSDQFSLW